VLLEFVRLVIINIIVNPQTCQIKKTIKVVPLPPLENCRGPYIYFYCIKKYLGPILPGSIELHHVVYLYSFLQSDAGVITFSQQNIFQTYLKSSIRCGVRGLPTAEQRYRNVNFYFSDLRKLLLHAIHMIPCGI